MIALVMAAALAVTPIDAAFDGPQPEPALEEPPAPAWPGPTLLIAGGTALTVSQFYAAAATFTFCFDCQNGGSQTRMIRETSFIVVGGVLSMLTGMMWLAWARTADAPRPKSPGVVALAAGLLEVAGGALRIAFVPADQPGVSDHREQLASCGIIIGSGVAALVAAVVWLVWAGQ